MGSALRFHAADFDINVINLKTGWLLCLRKRRLR
jgi:hypothetical protein